MLQERCVRIGLLTFKTRSQEYCYFRWHYIDLLVGRLFFLEGYRFVHKMPSNSSFNPRMLKSFRNRRSRFGEKLILANSQCGTLHLPFTVQ